MRAPKRVFLTLFIATAVVLAGVALSRADEPVYVGASKCKICHMSQYKVWAASKHAKALDDLPADSKTKPECLACHMTGYQKKAAEGAELNGVQCEACHGPGSDYKSMKIMSKKDYAADKKAAHAKATAAGLVLPTEESCKTCHNSKSPNFKGFDFASAKEKIKHWE